MPRVSREQADRHRVAITEASSRLFREHGLDKVSVAELMAAAGLTHGGFYGHFGSKEELAGEACRWAFERSAERWKKRLADKPVRSVARAALTDNYLSAQSRSGPAGSCPATSLATDVARSAADASPLLPLSRQGADASFQKFDVLLNYNQAVLDHFAVSFSARAQTSFNAPLLRSEQIGIANTTGLSAFDAGTIVGDQGYVVRGELQSPWVLPLHNAVIFGSPLGVVAAPYVFAAYGEVALEDPSALEAPRIHAASYGAGIRLGGAAVGTLSNGSLTLEYGHATISAGVPGGIPVGPGGDRFTVVSAFRF